MRRTGMRGIILFLFIFICSLSLLAQRSHVTVFLNKASDSIPGSYELVNQHKEYIEKLPNKVVHGIYKEGDEFIIFNTNKIEDVRTWILEDPAVNENLYRPEFFHTGIRKGEFCKTSSEKVNEYIFVRYTTHITKYNVQQAPHLLSIHDRYIKQMIETGNVLVEGFFENSDGGFMIFKGDLDPEVITNDPTYLAGFIIPEMNYIYMLKGSICE